MNRLALQNSRPAAHCSGFTLLEVIVAMAITGFVLGGLFSLVGGSKQLTWRAEDNLVRATRMRAAANFALLQNGYDELEAILENRDYQERGAESLAPPPRKTQATVHAIGRFEVASPEREEVISGTRWIQLDLPQAY